MIGYTNSNGDGTVPFVSADYSKGTEYYVKGGEHSKLPSMDGVRDLISSILIGGDYTASNVSTSPGYCPLKGKELNWRSPVSVQIYDSYQNHSGPLDDGTIEDNIPGATYDMIDGEAYIFLPTDVGQVYNIQGTGTAIGTFDLIVTDINNDQVTNNTLFNDVRIIPGSSVSFKVSQNSDDSKIGFDFNNSGKMLILQASNQFQDFSGALSGAIAKPLMEDSNQKIIGGKILGEMTNKFSDGMLILDNKTIFIIGSNGKKYGFTSENAFRGLGFRFDNALVGDVDSYELGGLVSDPGEIHPNGSVVLDGKTIWFINNEKRFGFNSKEQFLSDGFDLKQVVPANQNDMFLSETNIIK